MNLENKTDSELLELLNEFWEEERNLPAFIQIVEIRTLKANTFKLRHQMSHNS